MAIEAPLSPRSAPSAASILARVKFLSRLFHRLELAAVNRDAGVRE